jgi:hypothetical protein
MAVNSTALARRIVRERTRLLSHLPPFDPLVLLPPDDEETDLMVALDIDLDAYETTDRQRRTLDVSGVRLRTGRLAIYAPEWRRLYALTRDRQYVLVGDGDAERGETAWAAVYRNGSLVAALTESSDDRLV